MNYYSTIDGCPLDASISRMKTHNVEPKLQNINDLKIIKFESMFRNLIFGRRLKMTIH